MNVEALKLSWDVLQFVITSAVGIYVWLSNRRKVTQERIDKLEEHMNMRFNSQGERTTRVEAQVQNLPTAAVIHDLSAQVAELRGATSQLNQSLHLIQEHLLDSNRRR